MSRTSDRLIPFDVDAEEAVLGSLLVDPDAITRIVTTLTPDDFHWEPNVWIYGAILALHTDRQAIDFQTVCSRLDALRRLHDAGGPAYLTRLIARTPTSLHVEYYADVVRQASRRRQLIGVASEIAKLGHDTTGELDAQLDKAEALLFGVTQRVKRGDLTPISVGVAEVFDHIESITSGEAAATGLTTGLSELDSLTGGLFGGDYIVVQAPPSVGKSAFLAGVARHTVERGKTVAVFSLEMSIRQWATRFMSGVSGVGQFAIRVGKLTDAQIGKLTTAAGEVNEYRVWVDDTFSLTPRELRGKARRFATRHPLDLVIVDYAQLMTDPGAGERNRVNELERISRAFKALARELNIPILVASQVTRDVADRPDKRARMGDALGSGAFERDADMVLSLHREGYWEEDTRNAADYVQRDEVAEILVVKARHGRRGTVNVGWQGQFTRFVDLAEVSVAAKRERGT